MAETLSALDGVVNLGVIADADSTPDIATLAFGLEEGVEELLALVPGTVQSRQHQKMRA